MTVSVPHCFTCRHWLERDIHKGECRRFPPSLALNPMRSSAAEFVLSRRNDWCGEHQDKRAGREAA